MRIYVKPSFAGVTILCRLLLLAPLLVLLPLRAADPFISEFVPDNAGVTTDEDAQYVDLIEIQNPNGTPFNLAGYYLTDNPLQFNKWAFPPVTLPGNGFLVVFASGKNRTNDTNHLHTNFQLSKDGGYLALIKPDGSNIVNAFANYPAVKEDVSFGIAQKLIVTQPLAATIPQVLVPTNASGLPADWNRLSYTLDSSWTNGVAPPAVGFDTNQTGGLPVNVAPSGTAVQSTTYNGTTYPASLAINNIFSDFSHTATTDNNAFWQVTLTNEMAIYEVVIFNRGGGCCQWRLRDITVEIVTTNLAGSVTNWISPLLNPENVLNNPGYLTNNLVTITGGPVLGRTIIIHRKPDPDNSGLGTGTAQDDQNVLSMGEVVVTASLSAGLQPYFTTDIKNLMYQKNPSAFVRMPFVSTNTPDTLTLNVRYDDGFVAYLNGTEIARRNAPGSLVFDSAATVDRALTNVIAVETIDLSAGIPLLLNGTNLLAVQILNNSAANGDTLFQPQLIATRVQRTTNVFLDEVTLGALNDVPWYLDYVKDTHFSVDRGFFTNAFSLSITSGTPDALIYVSFNSDEPGPGRGFLYTNAFAITNTTVVRARAWKDNWKSSDVDTHTYLFLADVLYQAPNWQQTLIPPQYFPATWGPNAVDYGMDPNVVNAYTAVQWKEALTQIPTMSLVTTMTNLFDAATGIYANADGHGEDWERAASLELLDPTNAVPGRFQENLGLRIRGGASRGTGFRKHSFRVFFRKEYGNGKLHYPLFEDEGADTFETFDLRTSQNYAWARETSLANGTNDTMVREVFCRKTLGDMGEPYRRSRYYHLYLNGQYWGIYETDERPEASYGETYFGGSKTNFDVVKCGNHIGNFATEATDGNFAAWTNLWLICQAMRTDASTSNYFRTIGCNSDGTRNLALPVLLDVDNLIDYMLEIFYSGDGDATLSSFLSNNQPNNWFGMRDRTNPNVGFRFFNSDCEHTLGSPNSQIDRTGPFGGSNEGLFLYSNPQWMHEELMRNAEYRARFANHVQKHFFNGGACTVQAGTNRFIAKSSQLTKAIRANAARWGDAVVEPPYGENNWTNMINWILTQWFPPRTALVLAQLKVDQLYPSNSPVNFSQAGGAVPAGYSLTLTQTNAGGGVIYYTLDGSDPRAIGGGVAGSALAYSGALVINSPTLVRARVLVGGIWSALIEYTFYPPQDLSKLVLTELMYHPPTVGLTDGDEFEFLELKNTGTNSLNLSGLKFSAGITYTFPNGTTLGAGQFFVLARNAAQFNIKYPGVTVNGLYTGKLDNGGETVTLSHPLGAKILSVTYDDLTPWPITPDGLDFSLVPKDPNANPDYDNAANWRASSLLGGSPGADDPAATIPLVVINEVLTHSETTNDFIELFNTTTNIVDLGGWFLTDDPDVPKKFRIPDSTFIAPLGFAYFDETQFNPTPGTNNSFSLNARGDDVYLFSGDVNTNLSGYSHGFSFNAAADGETFGRLVISTGEEQFPAQMEQTPGTANAGPRIGPVVINEVMYNPAALNYEFVELRNITTNPVSLFDPAHPTNAWRLNGLGYNFPTNLTIPAQGFLLLAQTNVTAFTNFYLVPPGTQILAPYAGQLQDSGERLELQRPDVSDTNGLAYITVDEVRYNDKAPWPPAADGSGPSLQKRNPGLYGNDPVNWTAAAPTPGADFAGGAEPVISTQASSRSVVQGSNTTFTVGVSGTAPFSYQWKFNGANLLNETNATLTLTSVQPAQAGDYSVFVFNGAGATTSSNATLLVLLPVAFTIQPTNQITVEPGTNVTLVSLAVGNGTVRYQWRFEGNNLPNATNANYSFSNASLAFGHGNFSVVAVDDISTTTSTNAQVFVRIRPGITLQPMPQAVIQGQSAMFICVATGAPPISYRWLTNGVGYVTNTSGIFVFPNAQANFTVRANPVNLAGNVNSSTVNLTVLRDFDGDGIADSWETNYFGFNTNNPADGLLDFDGDGMSNRDEYGAGTNPTNALSLLKLVQSATNASVLQFEAQTNRTYTVLCRTNLSDAPWTAVTNIFPALTVRTVTVESAISPPLPVERYYRVLTPMIP